MCSHTPAGNHRASDASPQARRDRATLPPLEPTISSPFLDIARADWAPLATWETRPLEKDEIRRLHGLGDELSLAEVEAVYLPLARLIRLRVDAMRDLATQQARFLGQPEARVPFVIGLAGSVAVGKSTTARVLAELLGRSRRPLDVALVTTDGFLYPNAELERRGLLRRKGFPESYDQRALVDFVHALKAGDAEARCPVYSHLSYDVLPGEFTVVRRPDVAIVEGLNVLQPGPRTVVSDFFDFGIYVDADVDDLRRWYVARFLKLRSTAFRDPSAYFHRYASLTDAEAEATALDFWTSINEVNLAENILHTRERADLVLEKGPDHAIRRIRLRKF